MKLSSVFSMILFCLFFIWNCLLMMLEYSLVLALASSLFGVDSLAKDEWVSMKEFLFGCFDLEEAKTRELFRLDTYFLKELDFLMELECIRKESMEKGLRDALAWKVVS